VTVLTSDDPNARAKFISIHVPRHPGIPPLHEAALPVALGTGQVGGAALEFLEKEPHFAVALLRLPNVIAAAHVGSATAKAPGRVEIGRGNSP
jgi:Phosphoglycerate dehydrogenase and related dehydrogenases